MGCEGTARILFRPLTSFQNLQQHLNCLISENDLGEKKDFLSSQKVLKRLLQVLNLRHMD